MTAYLIMSAGWLAVAVVAFLEGRERGAAHGRATRGDAYNDGWHDGHTVGVRTGLADAIATARTVLATLPRSLGGRAIVRALTEEYGKPWTEAPRAVVVDRSAAP